MGNITSLFAPSSAHQISPYPAASVRLGKHLEAMSPSQSRHFVGQLFEGDSTARALCILFSDPGDDGRKVTTLTKEQLSLLCSDLTFEMADMTATEVYVEAVIDAIVDQVIRNKGEGLAQGVHNLVWLAWAMNEGKNCFVNADPSTRPPDYLQEKFVEAIEQLDSIAKDGECEWSLSSSGEHSLNILCPRHDAWDRVRHISNYSSFVNNDKSWEEKAWYRQEKLVEKWGDGRGSL